MAGGGGWSRRRVGTCACASSHRDTHFPLAFNLSLPKSVSSLLTGIVSLARPLATHSPYHHHLDHDLCVLTNNTAVRLKTRRAPRSIVGTLPRDLVTSTRSSLGCDCYCWTRSVGWLFEAAARRCKDSEVFTCCAGERGEPGETTALTIESLRSCEAIPAHPYPPALAVLHRRLH